GKRGREGHLAGLAGGERVDEEALAAEHRALQARHEPALHPGLDRDPVGHADHRAGDGLNLLALVERDDSERAGRAVLGLELHAELLCWLNGAASMSYARGSPV